MNATMTITGLYNWDNTIFQGWTLPENVDPMLLQLAIFQECAELELVISRPDLFKTLTNAWSQRRSKAWTRAMAAMNASYNPIENYDRTETGSESEIGSSGSTVDSDSTTSTQETDTRTPNLTDEHKVSAYNADASAPYLPGSEDTHTGTESNQKYGSASSSLDSSTTGEYGRQKQNSVRAHGNIGVTTSQQMVEAEINLAGRLDIYQYITQDFKHEFCVLVF